MVPKLSSEGFEIKTFLLLDLIDEIGDEKVNKLISSFFCTLNEDVEYFLKHKAITFANTNKGSSYLIIGFEDGKEPFICAYFTLSTTNFVFPKELSISKKKYLVGPEKQSYDNHPVVLVGQIGRNSSAPYTMEGKEIFKLIFEQIITNNRHIGGIRFIYLDAVNNDKLISRYESYGFKKIELKNGKPDTTPDNLVRMTMTMSYLVKNFKS